MEKMGGKREMQNHNNDFIIENNRNEYKRDFVEKNYKEIKQYGTIHKT